MVKTFVLTVLPRAAKAISRALYLFVLCFLATGARPSILSHQFQKQELTKQLGKVGAHEQVTYQADGSSCWEKIALPFNSIRRRLTPAEPFRVRFRRDNVMTSILCFYNLYPAKGMELSIQIDLEEQEIPHPLLE